MPIYAYKCESCGYGRDVLQKISDPVRTVCPTCGQESFAKQLTAAGFQLKGSGWYATDFRNNGSPAKPAAPATAPPADCGGPGAGSGSDGAAPAPAAGAPAASTVSATSCGGPCACHSPPVDCV